MPAIVMPDAIMVNNQWIKITVSLLSLRASDVQKSACYANVLCGMNWPDGDTATIGRRAWAAGVLYHAQLDGRRR